MRKPRILHLFNAFLIGGVERQHLLLVSKLRDKFEQVCWAFDHGPVEDALVEMGISHCIGPSDTVKCLMQQNPFDCVVVRTNRIIPELADFLRGNSTPVVYTRNYIRWPSSMQYFDPVWDPIGVGMADYCLFSGTMLRDPVLRLMGDVPGGEIIYNGLELDRYPLTHRRPLESRRPLRVGILANFMPHKNQPVAIESMRDGLIEGRYNLFLGGAPYNESFHAQARAAAEGLPVEFCGYVDDQIGFLNGIDVLLVSSTHEGWPNAIMEAFACGVPVVAPAIGDIASVFGNKPPGLLYPAGEYERIPNLLNRIREPEAYECFSRRAVARAKDFDIDKSVRILQRAIHSVLGTNGAGCEAHSVEVRQ
jgi:glycosyltransferase involved in cell wall biosynthesis